MKACIKCGGYIQPGNAYYNNGWAKVVVPIGSGLIADGPFCSKSCKMEYADAKEARADGKALKKEAKALGFSPGSGIDAGDLQEQRRIMELRKEEREAEESRVRREKEEEETRQRQAKAAGLRGQGHTTRAFLLHHQNALIGGGALYLFATFFASMGLSPHKGELSGWAWAASGLLVAGLVGWAVRRMVRENAAVKATI